eukprot:CAMPEP_0173204546 /NCGR_PEP_ID=MMETSP1141-20130122/20182_1 /TAXON_ID=483371 /ORGANISM="non described non described, Strain CCMP2298" /LENGTH=96 /DNA_ID=CAMNT_0014130221 /DNA_START=247 /DNA_END=533 /DNA_ORIENTATION=-
MGLSELHSGGHGFGVVVIDTGSGGERVLRAPHLHAAMVRAQPQREQHVVVLVQVVHIQKHLSCVSAEAKHIAHPDGCRRVLGCLASEIGGLCCGSA